jgi:cyclophilin family peptidyl-prolyl cis-trans isomerase
MARRQAQRQQERQARRAAAAAARHDRLRRRRQLVAVGVVAAMVLATVGAVIAAVGSDGTSTTTTTTASTGTTTPSPSAPAPVDEVALPAAGAVADGTCPPEDGSGPRITSWPDVPPLCVAATADGAPDPATDYRATLHTDAGDLTFLLNTEQAPWAVNDFVTLARAGYLDGTPIDTVLAEGWFEFGGRFAGAPDDAPGAGYTRPSEAPEVGSLYSPLALGLVSADPTGAESTGGRFLVATGVNAADLPADGTLFGLLLDGTEAYPRILRAGTSSGVPGEVIVIERVSVEPIEAL